MGATVLDRLISHRVRSDGTKKAAEKRKSEGEDVATNIKETKRLTAGVLTSNGIHSLDHPDFLNSFRERRKEQQEKREKTAAKKKEQTQKYRTAVKALRERHGHERTHHFVQFSQNDCRDYLQYKKRQGDSAMPSDLVDRKKRCVEWMHRPSPPASPQKNADGGDGEDNVSARAAEADLLLGLASAAANLGDEMGDDDVVVDEYGEEEC